MWRGLLLFPERLAPSPFLIILLLSHPILALLSAMVLVPDGNIGTNRCTSYPVLATMGSLILTTCYLNLVKSRKLVSLCLLKISLLSALVFALTACDQTGSTSSEQSHAA